MTAWPETRDTLLMRLQDPADQQAWAEFAQLYEPLIFRFAVRRGLQEADACDITQRVLCAVARAAERWEPGTEHGRFRGWLAKVTANAVLNWIQRGAKHRGSGRSSVWEWLEQVPEKDDELAEQWLHERRCQIFRAAADKVRSRFTDDGWTLFWRTAVDGEAIDSVATEIGKSIGAAYAIRSRVLTAIRKVALEIENAESQFES